MEDIAKDMADQDDQTIKKQRGRPQKRQIEPQSGENEGWKCDTCNVVFTDSRSKLLECDYCRAKRCIKCLKLSESVYKSIGDRPDFPWLCSDGCIRVDV